MRDGFTGLVPGVAGSFRCTLDGGAASQGKLPQAAACGYCARARAVLVDRASFDQLNDLGLHQPAPIARRGEFGSGGVVDRLRLRRETSRASVRPTAALTDLPLAGPIGLSLSRTPSGRVGRLSAALFPA